MAWRVLRRDRVSSVSAYSSVGAGSSPLGFLPRRTMTLRNTYRGSFGTASSISGTFLAKLSQGKRNCVSEADNLGVFSDESGPRSGPENGHARANTLSFLRFLQPI